MTEASTTQKTKAKDAPKKDDGATAKKKEQPKQDAKPGDKVSQK